MINIISHRGKGEHKHFENSKEAIISSLKLDYISGVEFDIRMTKDNKIVVFHDPILDFATNGSGFVKNKTLKQLKKYKMGIYYKIISLNEILREISKLKISKKIIIDVKQEFEDTNNIVHKLHKILSKYNNINIYVCSFNYNVMKKLKEESKKIKIGIIIAFGINKKRMYNHFNFNLVSSNYIDKIDRSKENFIFPINTKNELKKVIGLKNVSIITDKPYLFK